MRAEKGKWWSPGTDRCLARDFTFVFEGGGGCTATLGIARAQVEETAPAMPNVASSNQKYFVCFK